MFWVVNGEINREDSLKSAFTTMAVVSVRRQTNAGVYSHVHVPGRLSLARNFSGTKIPRFCQTLGPGSGWFCSGT